MSTTEPSSAPRSASVFTAKSRLRSFFQKWPPAILLALAVIGLMVGTTFLGHLLPLPEYQAMDLRDRLVEPVFMEGSWSHPLGTDELGRDVLSRLVASIQISLTIAFLATLVAATLGVALGFLAAFARGKVEQVILIAIDAQAAMPFMIIALAVLAFLGNSLTLFTVLLGFYGWERIARIARGLAIAAQEQNYAAAVRDLGASPVRVYGMHILPNIASTLLVSMTLNFPEVILLESGLSFLGLGVQPPETSLGAMVGYGRDYIQSAPWIMLAPAAVIVVTTLCISLIGDWLRDLFDPTLT
ncbi:ABC transporter permease (plasmid) [Paracoccus liaowanqingii]|uniref:ABC transporter permease n=1 Tax=Paracoccus liaowanqingii TaxID=2560053 RepID=A0A4Y5SS31_9RHOB|nr:ABC transporter permease [Paracoccus liaowanqingii]QDA36271.1 ABC transporter permease [Paracoccus liaowanqingii]